MNRGFIGALCLSVTFALLADCGGSRPPIGAPGAMPQAHTVRRVASSSDLIYATGGCGGTCVVSYPDGVLVQTLNIGENGACADSAGNVYIAGGAPSYTNTRTEDRHPLTPFRFQAARSTVAPSTRKPAILP